MLIDKRTHAKSHSQVEVATSSQWNKCLRFKVLPRMGHPKKVGLGTTKALGFQHKKNFLLLERAKVFGEAHPAPTNIVPAVAC